MGNKKVFFSLGVFILFVLTTCQVVSAGTSQDNLALSNLNVSKHILDNGLTILVNENHQNQLLAFEIIVKTGSLYEGPWQGSGIAHLVEHMCFKGTKQRPVGKIEEEVKALGGTLNGYTSYQFTGYTLSLPAEHFVQGLKILKDMLANPIFDEAELKKEKEVILNEIRLDHDDEQRYLERLFWMQAYSIAPYNLPVIGIAPLFAKLNRKDVIDFYKKWYIPNNIILVVSGDIITQEAVNKISQTFSDFKMKPYPQTVLPVIPDFLQQKNYEEEFDINISYLMLGLPSSSLNDPDTPALDILAFLLAQGESSRLYQKLYHRQQLAYSVEGYNFTPSYSGFFVLSFSLEEKNIDRVKAEVFAELEKFKKERVSQAEIEKAKNSFLSDYISMQETVQNQAHALAQDEAYTQNPYFSKLYLEEITKVTALDIKRAAQKYFNKNNLISVVLKPKSKIEIKNAPGPITAQPIKKYVFANGLILLFKKDENLPAVSVQAIFGGGTRWEDRKNNGVFNLMSLMLTKGTQRYCAYEIAQKVEQLGAALNSFSGYNSFGLSLHILSKDLKTGLEIFSDLILNSDFKEEELKRERMSVLKAIQIQDDDIYQNTLRLLRENLFSQSAYRFSTIGNNDSVEGISRQHLVSYYQKFCCPNNLVLAIFGDIDQDELLKLLEKKFGKWEKALLEKNHFSSEPPKEKQIVIENERDKEQAILMLGFPGVAINSNDRYPLEFLNSLLTESGSLLYNTIREKYGLSYALGGASVCGLDTGYFYIYVATNQEKINEVKNLISAEIDKLKISFIDEVRLEATKKYLISENRFKLQSNSALSFRAALDERYGLGFDSYLNYENQINRLKAQDIQEAAKKYLDSNKSVIIITRKKTDV